MLWEELFRVKVGNREESIGRRGGAKLKTLKGGG